MNADSFENMSFKTNEVVQMMNNGLLPELISLKIKLKSTMLELNKSKSKKKIFPHIYLINSSLSNLLGTTRDP